MTKTDPKTGIRRTKVADMDKATMKEFMDRFAKQSDMYKKCYEDASKDVIKLSEKNLDLLNQCESRDNIIDDLVQQVRKLGGEPVFKKRLNL